MAMLVLARNVLAITNALRSDIWDNARASVPARARSPA